MDALITQMGSLLLLMLVPLYPPIIGWVFGSIHDRLRPETRARSFEVARVRPVPAAAESQEQSAEAA